MVSKLTTIHNKQKKHTHDDTQEKKRNVYKDEKDKTCNDKSLLLLQNGIYTIST